jgi:hypothetical protein
VSSLATKVNVVRMTFPGSPNQRLREGMRAAKGNWCILMDPSLAFGADGIWRMAEELWSGGDLVIGSRLLPESIYHIAARLQDRAFRQRSQWAVLSAAARRLLPLSLRDLASPLIGLSSSLATTILHEIPQDWLLPGCQLALVAQHLGYSMTECPVSYQFGDLADTGWMQTSADVWRLLQVRQWYQRYRQHRPGLATTATGMRRSA